MPPRRLVQADLAVQAPYGYARVSAGATAIYVEDLLEAAADVSRRTIANRLNADADPAQDWNRPYR